MDDDDDIVRIMQDIIDMQNLGKKQIGEEMRNIDMQTQKLHDGELVKLLLSIQSWWWNMVHNDGMDMAM